MVHASPAIPDNVVYIGSWDRQFYALNAETGQKLWSFETGDDQKIFNQIGIASSAAVAEGSVYFGCRDWRLSSPVIHEGVVYIGSSDGNL